MEHLSRRWWGTFRPTLETGRGTLTVERRITVQLISSLTPLLHKKGLAFKSDCDKRNTEREKTLQVDKRTNFTQDNGISFIEK